MLIISHFPTTPSSSSGQTQSYFLCLSICLSCAFHINSHIPCGPLWLDYFPSVQFSSVAQSRPTLCNPMNHSTPGLPVHHQFLESTQTHVHRVGDAIQPSHPLSSPSPPAPSPSQHCGLFQWVNSSHEVTKILEFQLQYQYPEYSGLISFRMD